MIEGGTAVIRAEYDVRDEGAGGEGENGVVAGEGENGVVGEFGSLAIVKTHVLKIPDLFSISNLSVEIGDEVIAGQLLARYVDDDALELLSAELVESKQQLNDLEVKRLRAEELYDLNITVSKQEIRDKTTRLEKLRYLVERHAEPRNSLVDAQKALEAAEAALMMEETKWTSQVFQFEQDVRGLKLKISRVESQLKKELEEQWVRASVSGVVSDIKVTGVGVKGVDVEIVILEDKN